MFAISTLRRIASFIISVNTFRLVFLPVFVWLWDIFRQLKLVQDLDLSGRSVQCDQVAIFEDRGCSLTVRGQRCLI